MFEKRHPWQVVKPFVNVFDGPLALIIFLIVATGFVAVYSAGIDFPGRIEDHMRNILIAFGVLWIAANIPPQTLMRIAVIGRAHV